MTEQQTTVEPTGLPQTSQGSSEQILEQVIRIGKKILPGFDIPEEQKVYYINLALYFSGHPGCAWDLKKGLLISGVVGTGKTLSMRIMAEATRKFKIINTRYVIRDYMAAQIPVSVIDKYGRSSFRITAHGTPDREIPFAYCFDDFGLENVSTKNYGNQQNIMEEVMLDRYDMFLAHGMITHCTTNLSPTMIEKYYGIRVRDRLREMVNYIELQGASKRK